MLAETLEGVLSQVLCRRAGGEGRIPATELMFVNTAIRSMIRDGESHKIDSALQSGRAQGMHRLDDSLFRLAMEGVIGGEEAWSKANEKDRFTRFLPKDSKE
jgi:twitching motility protein PilT